MRLNTVPTNKVLNIVKKKGR